MHSFPKIILKPGKEKSVLNFHPWLFSGAISRMDKGIQDGDIAEVFSSHDEYLATGFYNNGSITVRLFSFVKTVADTAFWSEKIKAAFILREQHGLKSSGNTSAYRLIHGEGDGLPGLIVDIYDTTAVIQTHNLGMHKIKNHVKEALLDIYGPALETIYDKSADTMPDIEGIEIKNNFLTGSGDEKEIIENGKRFYVNWVEGQKTGFFLDQRDNRALLEKYSKSKNVLNAFCYSGGFSVYALQGGASLVDSVDSSAKAIDLATRNISLNNPDTNHNEINADIFEFLKDIDNKYDLIVLDPPAFAKHLSAVERAAKGYQKINRLAFEKIKPGGILFTFSCSQVIDKMLFRKIIFSAAAQSKRNIRILHQLSQGPDHPISIYHPEGEYLKGLVLYVE